MQPNPHPLWTTPAKKAAFLAAAILGLGLGSSLGFAQATPNPPARMSYQGYLVDSSAVALGNSAPKNFDVIFSLFDAETAGNLLWAEQQTVTVDKGFFNVLLGEGAAVGSTSHADLSSLFKGATASDRYVGITVKGIGSGGANVDIAPRIRLVSSPYAYLAQSAVKLVQTTGADLLTSADGTATLAVNTTVNGSLTTTGNISAPNVSASSSLSGGSLTVAGVATAGSYSTAGTVSAANLTATGTATVANLNASGTVTGTTIAGFGTVPLGGIIMWSGATTSIPSGWALCNGQTVNNRTTPDLQDRFVVGAGSTYAVKATGGAATVTLSVANLPPHTHTFTDAFFAENQSGGVNNLFGSKSGFDQDNSLFTRSATTDSTGSGSAFPILPPYYALAFIMRVQ